MTREPTPFAPGRDKWPLIFPWSRGIFNEPRRRPLPPDHGRLSRETAAGVTKAHIDAATPQRVPRAGMGAFAWIIGVIAAFGLAAVIHGGIL